MINCRSSPRVGHVEIDQQPTLPGGCQLLAGRRFEIGMHARVPHEAANVRFDHAQGQHGSLLSFLSRAVAFSALRLDPTALLVLLHDLSSQS